MYLFISKDVISSSFEVCVMIGHCVYILCLIGVCVHIGIFDEQAVVKAFSLNWIELSWTHCSSWLLGLSLLLPIEYTLVLFFI